MFSPMWWRWTERPIHPHTFCHSADVKGCWWGPWRRSRATATRFFVLTKARHARGVQKRWLMLVIKLVDCMWVSGCANRPFFTTMQWAAGHCGCHIWPCFCLVVGSTVMILRHMAWAYDLLGGSSSNGWPEDFSILKGCYGDHFLVGFPNSLELGLFTSCIRPIDSRPY